MKIITVTTIIMHIYNYDTIIIIVIIIIYKNTYIYIISTHEFYVILKSFLVFIGLKL